MLDVFIDDLPDATIIYFENKVTRLVSKHSFKGTKKYGKMRQSDEIRERKAEKNSRKNKVRFTRTRLDIRTET